MTSNAQSVTFNCINCGKEHTSINKHSVYALFCSNKCQGIYQKNIRYNNWLQGIYSPSSNTLRIYMLKLKEYKCEKCKLTSWNELPITLEVEHVDGDYKNNHPDNLKLLCPNCHSQTSTYKFKNKGKGRHKRKERYKQNKSY